MVKFVFKFAISRVAIMINSFLILFITIKVEIALILQGMSINTHSVMITKKQKILYTSLILFHHHSHIHTSFLSLFQTKQKNILKEVEKQYSLLFLSLSHYHPHTSFIISIEKNRKGEKKKREKVAIIYKMRG